MKINLEILSSAYLLGEKQIEDLRIKELVPKMIIRRRLTRASKIMVELQDLTNFEDGRVICGSSYGELDVTVGILESISKGESISPTDFQNSVYSTAASYLSILSKNKNEILTISSGDNTAKAVLKTGAVKALDGDELFLVCFETIDIPKIEEVNFCIDFLECGVALRVKETKKEANIKVRQSTTKGVPNSISELLHVAQVSKEIKNPVLEVLI